MTVESRRWSRLNFSFDIHLVVHFFASVVFLGNQNRFLRFPETRKTESSCLAVFDYSSRLVLVSRCSQVVFLSSSSACGALSVAKLDSCIFSDPGTRHTERSWWSYSNLNNYSRKTESMDRFGVVCRARHLRNFNVFRAELASCSIDSRFFREKSNQFLGVPTRNWVHSRISRL